MKNITLAFCLLLPCLSSAQFGVHGQYHTFNRLTDTDTDVPAREFPLTGFGAAIDYTFRLANVRIEFFPELTYAQTDSKNTEVSNYDAPHLRDMFFAFNFNTRAYLFDIEGDCDCPVWSKDGNVLKKGFWLELSPGVSYHNYEYFNVEQGIRIMPRPSTEDNFIALGLGLGAGLDIGISEHITLTPYYKVRGYLPADAANYLELQTDPELRLLQFTPGLRLGLQLSDEYTRNKRLRAKRERNRAKKQRF